MKNILSNWVVQKIQFCHDFRLNLIFFAFNDIMGEESLHKHITKLPHIIKWKSI